MTQARTIAIGDVHGCLAPLERLLAAIDPQADDTLVFLGDVIDRGSHSCQIIDLMFGLEEQCQLVKILGNHEQMLLESLAGLIPLSEWLVHGGEETLDSYRRGAGLKDIPKSHVDYLSTWIDYHETPGFFCAHGNYLADHELQNEPWDWLRWESLKVMVPERHLSGKTAILGHTSNKQGKILNLGHLVCIDTYCHGGGWLTALEPETGKIWQTNLKGAVRQSELEPPR